jgi:hypothetical protein
MRVTQQPEHPAGTAVLTLLAFSTLNGTKLALVNPAVIAVDACPTAPTIPAAVNPTVTGLAACPTALPDTVSPTVVAVFAACPTTPTTPAAVNPTATAVTADPVSDPPAVTPAAVNPMIMTGMVCPTRP